MACSVCPSLLMVVVLTTTFATVDGENYDICDYHDKVIRADTGTVTSPNFPRSYTNNVDCSIIIHGGNRRILVQTLRNETSRINSERDSLNTCKDYFIIADNAKNTTEKMCGPLTVNFTSNSSAVGLLFYSNDVNSDVGFKVKFEVTDMWVYEMCKHTDTVRTLEGYIVSENYPSNYKDNSDCIINIVAQENALLELTIEAYDTDLGVFRTCNDWVSIEDTGVLPPRVLLPRKVCTLTIDNRIISSSNMVRVKFHSDFRITKSGFKIRYRAFPATIATPATENATNTLVTRKPTLVQMTTQPSIVLTGVTNTESTTSGPTLKALLQTVTRKPMPVQMTTQSSLVLTGVTNTEMTTELTTSGSTPKASLQTGRSALIVGGIGGGVVLMGVIVLAIVIFKRRQSKMDAMRKAAAKQCTKDASGDDTNTYQEMAVLERDDAHVYQTIRDSSPYYIDVLDSGECSTAQQGSEYEIPLSRK